MYSPSQMEMEKNNKNNMLKVGCHVTLTINIVVIATEHCGGSKKSED